MVSKYEIRNPQPKIRNERAVSVKLSVIIRAYDGLAIGKKPGFH